MKRKEKKWKAQTSCIKEIRRSMSEKGLTEKNCNKMSDVQGSDNVEGRSETDCKYASGLLLLNILS